MNERAPGHSLAPKLTIRTALEQTQSSKDPVPDRPQAKPAPTAQSSSTWTAEAEKPTSTLLSPLMLGMAM